MASERLDIVPAQLRVLVTRRPRYACRRCSGAVVQGEPSCAIGTSKMASAPEHVVSGGLPTEALIAQVIDAKFGDHLPFYRQADIYRRQGISGPRHLGQLGRPGLLPPQAHRRAHAHPFEGRGPDLHALSTDCCAIACRVIDETPAPVLDPGRRRTKTGFFWSIVSDDRGHGGADPPIVMFHYAPVRGRAPDIRLAARRELAAPIAAAFRPWLEAQLSRIPRASKLAEDIRYTLGLWPGLNRFLEDGRLEMDTNPVENQIRPVALTRKNALFAGHEVGAENRAMLASLIPACKMSDVTPVDYLTETLRALLDGHPKSRIEDLVPWKSRKASSPAA